MLSAAAAARAGEKPVLSGKIFLQTPSGNEKPLKNAVVELRQIKQAGKIAAKTYTSNRGSFTFYGICKGEYYLRVVRRVRKQKGRQPRVYFQLQDNKKTKRSHVIIENPAKTKRMNILVTGAEVD